MSYKVVHRVDNEKTSTFNTDAELTNFVRKIAVENEDEDISITCIGEAKDYIRDYCDNLYLVEVKPLKGGEKLFTLADLKCAFIGGEAFEKDTTDYDMGEVDEVTVPDFDEWLEINFNISLE
jgi:hypothetical protein